MEELYESGYQYFRTFLEPGEQILWQGQPGPGKRRNSKAVPVLFSVLWLGFSLFWEVLAVKSQQIVMILFGLPFILVGLHITFGNAVKQSRLKGKEFYAVTDRRLLIREGDDVQMYTPEMLPPMMIHRNKNGTSTISFTRSFYANGKYYSEGCTLENLTDVAQAQSALNRMLAEK